MDFWAFCKKHGVSKAEMPDLIWHLAHWRMRRTVEALSQPLKPF